MFDIWGFLIQTLTATGVAIMIIFLKKLFEDKLPPRWQFAIWGVLAVVILIPAGWNGRYVIVNWRYLVEIIKCSVGDFSITRVIFPFPIITALPKSLADWIFTIYFIGVTLHIIAYLYSYAKLRVFIRKSKNASEEIISKVKEIAESIKIKPCKVVEAEGVKSAFVCGFIRPILVVPNEQAIDSKILLHELVHIKSKDTIKNLVICMLRSIHWCNPILIYCANAAINDIEHRCDQIVLENLEGEERRNYGYVLLSMANDKFTKTPGTTCINNGGKHIGVRIKTIARFKKYPVGMNLVSVCVLIILTIAFSVGVDASEKNIAESTSVASLASARCNYCTTYEGAFDTYGRAVLEKNGYYRIMCAPNSMHKEIYDNIIKTEEYAQMDFFIAESLKVEEGYFIYNLQQVRDDVYEGTMVFELDDCSNLSNDEKYIATQKVRVEKKKDRWTAVPTEKFNIIVAEYKQLETGCKELPCVVYSGYYGKFRIDVNVQVIYTANDLLKDGNKIHPGATFKQASRVQDVKMIHFGNEKERNEIKRLGLSIAPVYPGTLRPEKLEEITEYTKEESNIEGYCTINYKTEQGWGPTYETKGMTGYFFGEAMVYTEFLPEYYVVDLYVNNIKAAQIDLNLQGVIEQ